MDNGISTSKRVLVYTICSTSYTMGLVLKRRIHNAAEWLVIMAKKKQFKKPKEAYNGWVYLLKIWIGSDIIFKVGTTNRQPYTRMLEVAGELYNAFGYIPKMTIVREHRVLDNYAVEAEILKETAKWRYELQCVKDVCGESELRLMNEQEMCAVYDRCILTNYPATECYKVEI